MARRTAKPTFLAPPGVSTRGQKRSSEAVAKVMKPSSSTEMLQAVLQFLPMRDVYRAQRVCRKWRDVIDDSIPLQKKMYLRSSGGPLKPNADASENKENFPIYTAPISINPAVGMWRTWGTKTHAHVGKDSEKNFGAVAINQVTDAVHDQPTDEYGIFLNVGNFDSLQNWVQRRTPPIQHNWMRQLVVQPPVLAMQLTHSGPEHDIEYYIFNYDGVTWGDVYRELEAFEQDFKENHGKAVPPGTVCVGFRVKADSLGPEMKQLLETCKGHADWDGLCGCLWAFRQELEY